MFIDSYKSYFSSAVYNQKNNQLKSNLFLISQNMEPDSFKKSYTSKKNISFGQVLTSNSEMNRAVSYEIFKQIKKASSIALFIHKNPDSDCLGSAIMMKQALDGMFNGEKKVQIFSEPISGELKEAHQIPKKFISQTSKEESFDLGISLDCASEAVMFNPELFNKCKYKINIDHHKTNTNLEGEKFVDLFLVDPEYISTTQLLYEEFFNRDYGYKNKHLLDKNTIENAAIGLEVDRVATNSIGNELANQTVRDWIQKYRINMKKIWENVQSQLKLTAEETRVCGEILSKTAMCNGVAYAVVKDNDSNDANIERIKIKVINNLMEIKDVKAAIVFHQNQTGDLIKVNLRGKTVDVGEVARKFGGGGHKNASGFIIRGEKNIDKVVKDVLREAKSHKCECDNGI